MALLIASSKSESSTEFLFFLAARIAASFTTFAKSAPAKPGVLAAINFKSTSLDSFTFFECIFNISSLPFISGLSTRICLSNLPGLNKAGSSISGLFVAAIIIIPFLVSNPSISTSNC